MTSRKWVVTGLVVFSIVCAIAFAIMLGSLIHTTQRAVGAGGPAPSAVGYIATILALVGSVLGGRWAQWLSKAAEFAPVVEGVVERFRGGPAVVIDPIAPTPSSTIPADLKELVDSTIAWAANKADKSLERRWAMASLTAFKDVASFESPQIAASIGAMGTAIINECLGSTPVTPAA